MSLVFTTDNGLEFFFLALLEVILHLFFPSCQIFLEIDFLSGARPALPMGVAPESMFGYL
jgi:hypothetical protein